MNRRGFLALAATSILPGKPAAAAPLRVGWVTAQRPESLAPAVAVFRAGLAALGWVENRDVVLDFRYGNDQISRVPDLVADLIRTSISVLIVQGSAAAVACKLALPVPIVFVISSDPVSAGFAQSLARPRAGLTGLTFMAVEMNAKRLELLHEIIPSLRHVLLMCNPAHAGTKLEEAEAGAAAQRLGLDMTTSTITNEEDVVAALDRISRNPPGAVSLLPDGVALQYRQRIIDELLGLRVPVISGWSVFARSGALCSYGPRLTESYRRLARFVDRILRGAQPSDLPIERPSVFELVVNLRTASTLGIPLPTSIVARADELIE